MNTIILLSPAMRMKVEAVVMECLMKAERKFNRKFDMPEIRYDVEDSHSGIAYPKPWLIRLNMILLVENEKEFLRDTVVHEVAHLITDAVFAIPPGRQHLQPHGKEWASVMELFGAPVRIVHSYQKR